MLSFNNIKSDGVKVKEKASALMFSTSVLFCVIIHYSAGFTILYNRDIIKISSNVNRRLHKKRITGKCPEQKYLNKTKQKQHR